MHIRVLFFAALREGAGVREAEIEVPAGTTIEALKSILAGRFPGISGTIGHALVAVNHEYDEGRSSVPDGAEVAVFPPVSGGGDAVG